MNNNGGIRIDKRQLSKDDSSLILEGAVLVRITNQGQNHIWIDQQEVIEPGESWVEGDLNGPGLYHSYSLNFLTNPSPPVANKPLVYPGNFANIRIFKRDPNAGK